MKQAYVLGEKFLIVLIRKYVYLLSIQRPSVLKQDKFDLEVAAVVLRYLPFGCLIATCSEVVY